MTKTAEAFRTISEVADELEVPKHVLRFWEGRFPQIRPMKRGGGRRYYRPEDMSLLRGICHLLHAEGYTIKGVQKILREQGVDTVKRFGADPAATAAPVAAAPRAGTCRQARRQEDGVGRIGSARGLPSKADVRERLLAAIAELENCRGILLGKPPESAARRSAHEGAARCARVSGIQTPELWCVDLGAAGPALHTLEERTPRLSPADRVRALPTFSDPIVRAEWLATHIALRLLIERAAGTQWRRAAFTRSERGKPHLDGAPLAFSISHAPGLGAHRAGAARQHRRRHRAHATRARRRGTPRAYRGGGCGAER